MITVGGDNFDKAIKKMMSVIMTDELAGQCTWSIKKSNKTKISNYNFPNIISGKLPLIFKKFLNPRMAYRSNFVVQREFEKK